mmetsp:Transcript_47489/g.93642  ORF Transcript_47489/g.93642 Transcript_47489/m.93642 type:complete len:210 (+) Transcript_47489:344-973(+)
MEGLHYTAIGRSIQRLRSMSAKYTKVSGIFSTLSIRLPLSSEACFCTSFSSCFPSCFCFWASCNSVSLRKVGGGWNSSFTNGSNSSGKAETRPVSLYPCLPVHQYLTAGTRGITQAFNFTHDRALASSSAFFTNLVPCPAFLCSGWTQSMLMYPTVTSSPLSESHSFTIVNTNTPTHSSSRQRQKASLCPYWPPVSSSLLVLFPEKKNE